MKSQQKKARQRRPRDRRPLVGPDAPLYDTAQGITLRLERGPGGVLVDSGGRDPGTDERAGHDQLGRRQVFDGSTVRLVSGVTTTLDRLLASGLITKAMWMAGVRVADTFEAASMERLGSCLGREPVSGGEGRSAHITETVRAARVDLEALVDLLGGYESRAARAVLDIAGLNLSLREHVAKQRAHEGRRAYSVDMARGIIPVALLLVARSMRLNDDRPTKG